MGQVAGDIARAARHKALAFKFHHRDRGFRRDSSHFAPDELIQHDIAQHEDARPARGREQFARLSCLQPGRVDDFYFIFDVHESVG